MAPLPSPLPSPPRLPAPAAVALAWLAAGAAALVGGCGPSDPRPVIGVYSGRHYNTDQDIYRRFTASTGIRIRLLEAQDDALIERLQREGAQGPADVLILADAARLDRATDLGLFRSSPSAALDRDVPADLRDPQHRWYGLTRRVRLVVVNPALVPPARIRHYSDLADPALRGKLCLRDRRSVYNQSLVADQIVLRGAAATEAWLKGLTANVTQPYFTSDIPLVRAVASGQCGVGVVNSYYLARMRSGVSGGDDRRLATRVQAVFPDPAHVNLTGGGVTRHARQPKAAQRLLEFLASPATGRAFAEANLEYPLKGDANHPILKALGPFRPDGVSAHALGRGNAQAVRLMERYGWF